MTMIALYPGTFDPIHLGHVDIIVRAARLFSRLVVGVYDEPAKRLMFSVEERVALAQASLAQVPKIRVVPYSGLTVRVARQVGAQVIVRGLRMLSDFELEYRMALANHELDATIEVMCLITHQPHAGLSSTLVKEIALLGGDVSTMVSPAVAARLREIRDDKDHRVRPTQPDSARY